MKKQAKPTHPKNETDNSGTKETPASQTDDTQRVSDQWIRIFLDSGSDMAFLKDENFRHIIVNPALCKVYGKTESEVLGKTDFDLIDEKAAVVCRKTDEQTLRQNDLHISEEVVGGRFYETRKFPVKLEDDKNGVGGYIRDITDRKRAEELLVSSEQKYRTIVENITDALYIHDFTGCILDCNQEACRMTGYSRDELIGQSLSMTDSDENKRLLPERMQRLMRDNMILFDGYHIRKDGSKVAVEVCAKVVSRENNGIIQGFVRDITERKQKEEALLFFMESVKNASDAIGMSTPEGNHYYQNAAFTDLLGQIGDDPLSAYVDKTVGEEIFRSIMAGGRWAGEVRMFGKDRRVLDILLRAYAIKNSDGRVTGLVGIHTDITERKRAEAKLSEVGKQWQNTFDASNDAIWILDREQQILRSNKSAERLFHRPSGEIIGKHCWEILHGTAQPIHECPFLRTPKSLNRESMELQIGENWFEVTVDPIVDEAGNYKGAVHIVSNITERKQAEDALRESEESYRRITENMSDFVSELDAQGVFRYNSPSIRRILGYDPEGLIGSSAFDFVHPEDRDLVIATYMDGIKTESDRDVEQRYRRKDGTYIWLRSSGHPLSGSDGKNIGMIVNSNDITERKQAESQREVALKKIRNLNENLEKRIEERTAELRKTIDKLEETNRAFVGRELKMIELKERIAELEGKQDYSDSKT